MRVSVWLSSEKSEVTVGNLVSKADSWAYKPDAKAQRIGLIPSQSTVQDFKRAAAYLLSERAAVSCVCNGYIITK